MTPVHDVASDSSFPLIVCHTIYFLFASGCIIYIVGQGTRRLRPRYYAKQLLRGNKKRTKKSENYSCNRDPLGTSEIVGGIKKIDAPLIYVEAEPRPFTTIRCPIPHTKVSSAAARIPKIFLRPGTNVQFVLGRMIIVPVLPIATNGENYSRHALFDVYLFPSRRDGIHLCLSTIRKPTRLFIIRAHCLIWNIYS